jgi:hypothetical protein
MKRKRAAEERGFVILTVLLVLVMMVAAVSITLKEAANSLQEASSARARGLVLGAMEHGLNQAMDQLQVTDPAVLADPTTNWDIFGQNIVGNEFIPPLQYPLQGELQNALQIRIGLRPGQRTRAPVGEDVRSTYGHVVEVQLSVRANTFGAGAEERTAVGVLIPHTASHSN